MFDDPKKSLDRLQRELLAAEGEEYISDEDADEALAQMREYLAEEEERDPLYRAYGGEEEGHDPVYADDPKPDRPKSGNRGLAVAIVLEILGLLALGGWWLLCRQ